MRSLYRDILHGPIINYHSMFISVDTFSACPHLLIHLTGEHLHEFLVTHQRFGVERLEALVLQCEPLKCPQRRLLLRADIEEVLILLS